MLKKIKTYTQLTKTNLPNQMRQITTDQIRTALVHIAEQSNRPHFGMFVVREVVRAIKYNHPHQLKNVVLREIYVLYGDLYKPDTEQFNIADKADFLAKLCKIKDYYAGQKILVSESGVSERTISLLLRGKLELTAKVWEKIDPVLDRVLEELEEHHKEKEKNSHGKYVTYRKGCRCEPCRIAWRNYIKESTERKKLNG